MFYNKSIAMKFFNLERESECVLTLIFKHIGLWFSPTFPLILSFLRKIYYYAFPKFIPLLISLHLNP